MDNFKVEVNDVLECGRWQWLAITHTHRHLRGSKLDVYLNGALKDTTKLHYPNVAGMQPVTQCYIGMSKQPCVDYLQAQLGPVALFSNVLSPASIMQIKTLNAFDSRVINPSLFDVTAATPSESIIFAYDARHCDRLRGICYDSSSNGNHGEAVGAGLRLRQTSTLKECIWQLGGPSVCLPLLISVDPYDQLFLQSPPKSILAQSLGPKSMVKAISLIGEILRHSSINKFCFRRQRGMRQMAILLRLVDPSYLTDQLLQAVERLIKSVSTDSKLYGEATRMLLFNFRIWVNATLTVQRAVFEKLESSPDALPLRGLLRSLTYLYDIPTRDSYPRVRSYTSTELHQLKCLVMQIVYLRLTTDAGAMDEFLVYAESDADDIQLAYMIELLIRMNHMTEFTVIIPFLRRKSNQVRYLTLRMIRTLVTQGQELTASDVDAISAALQTHSLSVACYNELIGLLVADPTPKPAKKVKFNPDIIAQRLSPSSMLFTDERMQSCTIKHSLLMNPILQILSSSATLSLCALAVRQFMLIFCSENIESSVNRRVLFGQDHWARLVLSFGAISRSSDDVPLRSIAGLTDQSPDRLMEVALDRKNAIDMRLNAVWALDAASLFQLALQESDILPQVYQCLEKNFPIEFQQHIIDQSVEFVASVVRADLFTGVDTWITVQDPLQLTHSAPLLMERVLQKIHEHLTAQPHLPPRNSDTFYNIQHCCDITAAMILEYDSEYQSTKDDKDIRMIAALLQVWQHFSSILTPDLDATFGPTAHPNSARRQQTHRRSRPTHPGGPMREVLQVLCKAIVLAASDRAMFQHWITRLIQISDQFRLGNDASIYSAGFSRPQGDLIVSSEHVRASPGPETCLVLWMIPELYKLITLAGELSYVEESRQLAEFVGRFLTTPVRSLQDLYQLLQSNDFMANLSEIERRDQFYREQLDTGRERRVKDQIQPVVVEPPIVESRQDPWYQTQRVQDEEDMASLRRYITLQPTISGLWCQNIETLSLKEPLISKHKWKMDQHISSGFVRRRVIQDIDFQPMGKMIRKTPAVSSTTETSLHVAGPVSAFYENTFSSLDDTDHESRPSLLQLALSRSVSDDDENTMQTDDQTKVGSISSRFRSSLRGAKSRFGRNSSSITD